MDFKFSLISFMVFIFLQVIFYKISLKKAVESYWFLAIFYFSVLLYVQGLIIFCRKFGIEFYEGPLLVMSLIIILKRGIKKAPSFDKLIFELPNFYFFSALSVAFIWLSCLSRHTIWTPIESTLEAAFWAVLTALILPIISGLQERLELMDIPLHFSIQSLLLLAVSFLILCFSYF